MFLQRPDIEGMDDSHTTLQNFRFDKSVAGM